MTRPVATSLLVCLVLATGVAVGDLDPPAANPSSLSVATFAGGCFWCMEPPFDALDGVVSTTSGYSGGDAVDPTYQQVSAGRTGHTEAVQVRYDPSRISYPKLLEVFWQNIDPTVTNRQFCDIGSQYRSAIFYHDEEQRKAALRSRREIEDRVQIEGSIVTEIVSAAKFWPAEEYHQDYYQKNPLRYKLYRYSCGRDQRLEELWGETG